ncbi:LysR family transcriptional regulator [Sphingomonas morindae]|uniref:LysR family transcriptional regulator n=1 Tax=Sphingomonas morindae TaxID=1541170 RepID=A0ABY4X9H3_9SPHN|nr:LysR family transcriptional regulator [Sphingomonas morindae]USI73554.1 LysR family transcriptional regulator [Sphingomonas morindae]
MVQQSRTIDLHELRVFASVVRQGGITAAARALDVSKSTISMQITRLEARLGVRLVERTSRRVALTREGEQLLPRIQSILAEADYLLEDMDRARTSPRGLVRIAVPPAFGGALLGHLVPAIAERYPDIELAVEPSYDLDDVQDPAFDFAVRVGQVGDDGLIADRVGSFARILVGSAEAAMLPSDIAMLDTVPLLAFSGSSTRVSWQLRKTDGSGGEIVLDCSAKVAVRDFDLLLRLVRAGQGVTMVPAFMVRQELASGRLVHLFPEWASPEVDVLLAYRIGASRISRVAAVLDEARKAALRVLAGEV